MAHKPPYSVGVIGYGWAATAHIAAINATTRGRVTAVCSSRPLDAAELSAKHGVPIKVYRKLDDLLADPAIDVVDITGLPSLHRDQAVAANGVKGCVCFECRFSSQFQVTRALLDEGLLGKLHYGEVD